MRDLWKEIERILPEVQRPTRYINREWNSIHKDHRDVQLKIALVYPDVYEVGMPNLGLQILYEILNSQDDVLAERAYAPWVDMEKKLRQRRTPLFSLESHLPLASFDVLGLSLQYEMTYTNVLNILDLAGIPLHAAKRDERDPLVIGGGPCIFNPEPLAPFFDFFVIGEGEEVTLELIEEVKRWQRMGNKRRKVELLKTLARIPGIYVPSFYRVGYEPTGRIGKVEPISEDIPQVVSKRFVSDLDRARIPMRPIVPYMEVIHDRCSLEIMRGCTRGCRFCQAGMIYRPARERSAEYLKGVGEELLRETGYEDISLASLSTSDYGRIEWLVEELMRGCAEKGVSISLPSLRVDTFSVSLAEQIQRVKKTGLTFAPEAGTQRLRDAINKGVTERDLLNTVRKAFEAGWRKLKFYFMVGLPTENQDDLKGIVELAQKILKTALSIAPEEQWSRILLTFSVSPFVPKPHTPFQWVAQDTISELERKQNFLKRNLRGRYIALKWRDARLSFIEAVLARGDRRVAGALERAWRLGCKLDAWTEHFRFDLWQKVFESEGLSMDFYANRERPQDEVFPWDHLSTGVSKEFLWQEYRRALSGITTQDCRWGSCVNCGVCPKGAGTRIGIRNSKLGIEP